MALAFIKANEKPTSCVVIKTGSVLQLIVLMAAMTAPLGRGGYLVQKEFSSCYNVAIITCSFMCISVNYSKGKPHNPTHYLTNVVEHFRTHRFLCSQLQLGVVL